jgi:hypothetical protein
MVCVHLAPVEAVLTASGAVETYRGQAWSDNCREWVYFDVPLDPGDLRARFHLGPMVVDHRNTDPKSGLECGLVCTTCHDAIMGRPG